MTVHGWTFWKDTSQFSLKDIYWRIQFQWETILAPSILAVIRPVFTHGPPGPGPRAANFQGRHIKKNWNWSMVAGKKGCPRERNLRKIYTVNRMCSSQKLPFKFRRWHVLSFFGTIISDTKEQKLFGPISEYQHCTQNIPEYASNKLFCWTILFCSGNNQQLFTHISNSGALESSGYTSNRKWPDCEAVFWKCD